MRSDENPYDWQGDNPKHSVRREELLVRVIERIGRGESGYLVGCRGMGKSVFLQQLESDLRGPDRDLLMFRTPGLRQIAGAIQAIAEQMVEVIRKRDESLHLVNHLQECAAREDLRKLFGSYLDAAPHHLERLVLLYDELDAYAEFGRPFFNELEDIRKNSNGRIVVFAAGGLGLMALDTLLGSSFFSRLTPELLEPFDQSALARLAEPFAERGAPLSPEVLDALRLASGGNLALATFGFQRLWSIKAPSPRDVTEIFEGFPDKHARFLDKIRDPIFASDRSNAPERVWRELQKPGDGLSQQRLRELVHRAEGKQKISAQWVFQMLRSTGLIRASDNAYRRARIEVEIIPSLLTFEVLEEPNTKETLREQLVADLCDVLTGIHRMSPDFFRSDEKDHKHIVPEAVFSAALVLGLEPRGWKAEREAQSAAGRTDIKARHVDFGEQWAIVEVKIWGRHDHEEIHAQVVHYWSEGVTALATVTVADLQQPEWSAAYEKKCLTGKVPTFDRKEPPSALAGHFVARTEGCPVDEVDHLLLRLRKRP